MVSFKSLHQHPTDSAPSYTAAISGGARIIITFALWNNQCSDPFFVIDPVGTTLGVLGVVELLTVCLDCFNFIDDGLSLGKDFVLYEGQFSALRIRLYAWGKACGFMNDGGYDERLDHPSWKQHVQKQLNSITLLFFDVAKLVRKYDLVERYQHHVDSVIPGPNCAFIDESLHGFLKRIKKTKRRAGIFGALRWALTDKRMFAELLHRLKECIEALEFVSKNLDLFETERQIVQDQTETIEDVNTLQSMIALEESASGSDVVSDAASQRLLRLQTGSVASQALASGGAAMTGTSSTYISFVTAQSLGESKLSPNSSQRASGSNHLHSSQNLPRQDPDRQDNVAPADSVRMDLILRAVIDKLSIGKEPLHELKEDFWQALQPVSRLAALKVLLETSFPTKRLTKAAHTGRSLLPNLHTLDKHPDEQGTKHSRTPVDTTQLSPASGDSGLYEDFRGHALQEPAGFNHEALRFWELGDVVDLEITELISNLNDLLWGDFSLPKLEKILSEAMGKIPPSAQLRSYQASIESYHGINQKINLLTLRPGYH